MAGWRLYKWVQPFETPDECRRVASTLSEKIGYTPEPKSDPIVSINKSELIKIVVVEWGELTAVQVAYASQNGSPLLKKINTVLGAPGESETLLESIPVRNYMGP